MSTVTTRSERRSAKSRRCRLDTHKGGVIMSVKLPFAGTWVERTGGHIFKGGILAEHYSNYKKVPYPGI